MKYTIDKDGNVVDELGDKPTECSVTGDCPNYSETFGCCGELHIFTESDKKTIKKTNE